MLVRDSTIEFELENLCEIERTAAGVILEAN